MKKSVALKLCFLISLSYFKLQAMQLDHRPVASFALAATALKNAGNVSNKIHKSEGTNPETGAKVTYYIKIDTAYNATKAIYPNGSIEYTGFKRNEDNKITQTDPEESKSLFEILEKMYLKTKTDNK